MPAQLVTTSSSLVRHVPVQALVDMACTALAQSTSL